jgi:hypothetical protein
LDATELADRPADPGSGGAAGVVAAIIARDRPDAQQKAMGRRAPAGEARAPLRKAPWNFRWPPRLSV